MRGDGRQDSYLSIPFERALSTETKVESGTSQSKSGTSVNLSNSGDRLLNSFLPPSEARRGKLVCMGPGSRVWGPPPSDK